MAVDWEIHGLAFGNGEVPLHLDDGYAQFNEAHLGPNGVIG